MAGNESVFLSDSVPLKGCLIYFLVALTVYFFHYLMKFYLPSFLPLNNSLISLTREELNVLRVPESTGS